jgi:molecular chaperone GrpE
MTEKALLSAFERNGLKRVEPARGVKFDPHQHEAVMEQPADDVGQGAVLQVLQAGYELFGRLVRPAMVVVSAKGSTGPAPSGAGAAANPYADAGASVDQTA